jgi:hypothetical protein
MMVLGVLVWGNICVAQRNYVPNSVLAQGNIYKIAMPEEGMYKIDAAFLRTLGINNPPLNSIHLYTNGGQMLEENNNSFYIDDVRQLPIQITDDGDNIFNNNDYLIFYSNGPNAWHIDSINKWIGFQKNLYDNNAYGFIKIDNTPSLRIGTDNPIIGPTTFNINTYIYKTAIEDDNINVLKSGKQWLDKVINNANNNYIATINFPATPADNTTLQSRFVGRSVQGQAILTGSVNNNVFENNVFNQVGNGVISRYAQENITTNTLPLLQNNTIRYTMQNNPNATIWADYLVLNTPLPLQLHNNSHIVIDQFTGLGIDATSLFTVGNTIATTQVWDITQALNPKKIPVTQSGTQTQFIRNTKNVARYIAFNETALKIPNLIGSITNTNIHGMAPAPYLIITSKAFFNKAQELANYHAAKRQINSQVLTIENIYNEFGSGRKDVTAIRNCIRMFYDKGRLANMPLAYVLLLGDASYNYKSAQQNLLVPSWQSTNSLDPIQSYVSDDFYGLLDATDDINNTNTPQLEDVAIGRIPARDTIELEYYLNKLYRYYAPESFGEWRTNVTFVADDEDNNLHVSDAEFLVNNNLENLTQFTVKKIYLDAFVQSISSGSGKYPTAVTTIANTINKGNIIWNYSGHGAYNRLSEESVVELPTTATWKTENKWPIFVTATCDFAPFDNENEFSLGEQLLLKQNNGGIALLTTTRLVFASSNKILNNAYLSAQFTKTNNFFPSIGHSILKAKNALITQGDPINAHKFVCLGDPSIIPAFPTKQVKTTFVNNTSFNNTADTLKGLQKLTLKGAVYNNNTVSAGFNGKVNITIYDKKQLNTTLANDATSFKTSFTTNENIVYKGLATVNNGLFETSITLPADINITYGTGLIKYYAYNNTEDAMGADSVTIGGIMPNAVLENKGPDIAIYANNNSITAHRKITNPITINISLFDTSGINLSNTSVGHEITMQVNGNPDKLVLNDFFVNDAGIANKGNISYLLGDMPLGTLCVTIKAWDIFNNSSEKKVCFEIVAPNKPTILQTVCYPNPFQQTVTITANHNIENTGLEGTIELFDATGKLLLTQQSNINQQRDGYTQFIINNQLGNYKGLIFYKIRLWNSLGGKTSTSGKMLKL